MFHAVCYQLPLNDSNTNSHLTRLYQFSFNQFRWRPFISTLSKQCKTITIVTSLQKRHNERDGVSNHQPRECLLNSLIRCRSKKTSKLRVTGLCAGNLPHKGPVTRKMFPFDDVIMFSFTTRLISIYTDCLSWSCALTNCRIITRCYWQSQLELSINT